MARISDLVETLLKQMIDQNGGRIEITRSELAVRVNCVPSQITYVLATRFTNDQGFLVESRRGGGGWIRIHRVQLDGKAAYLMHALNAIGDTLSQHQAEILIRNFLEYDVVDDREGLLIRSAISDHSLIEIEADRKDHIRMAIFKNMLISLIVD